MAINEKLLKKLTDSAAGRELVRHIGEVILSTDTLEGIDFRDKNGAAIEGRARQLTVEKLKKIFESLLPEAKLDTIGDTRDDFSVEVD